MNQDLLEKAISGDAESQYQLALCYRNGEGVEQSNEEAAKWYRFAAEQGDSIAQYNLGNCYENGEGVEQSYEEAEKWYRKAAEQGDSDAQEALTELEYNKKNKSRK